MTDLSKDDVTVEHERSCFNGFLSVTEYQFAYPSQNAKATIRNTLEVVKRRDAVAVLLVHKPSDQFVFVEQFRGGAYVAEQNPWLVEVVAGLIDDNEAPEAAAMREAQEEAGVYISELVHIQTYMPTPGAFSEMITMYAGFIDELPTQISGGVAAESEDIRIHVVDIALALSDMRQGRFKSGPILMALMWYQNQYA